MNWLKSIENKNQYQQDNMCNELTGFYLENKEDEKLLLSLVQIELEDCGEKRKSLKIVATVECAARNTFLYSNFHWYRRDGGAIVKTDSAVCVCE